MREQCSCRAANGCKGFHTEVAIGEIRTRRASSVVEPSVELECTAAMTDASGTMEILRSFYKRSLME